MRSLDLCIRSNISNTEHAHHAPSNQGIFWNKSGLVEPTNASSDYFDYFDYFD